MFKLAIKEASSQHCLAIRKYVQFIIWSWSGHSSHYVRPGGPIHPLIRLIKNYPVTGVPVWNDIDWFLTNV